jgi:hypothetical protein
MRPQPAAYALTGSREHRPTELDCVCELLEKVSPNDLDAIVSSTARHINPIDHDSDHRLTLLTG